MSNLRIVDGEGDGKILFIFAVFAFALSWAIEIPLALQARGVVDLGLPFILHYLAAFGPAAAALLLTWKEGKREGIKELASRLLRWRVSPLWWIVAVSPLILFFLVAVLGSFMRGEAPDFRILARFDFLPDLGIASVLVWLTTYGFGEEIGWRGFFLPRLQKTRGPLSASLLLWLIWAAWHIPSFFYLHTAPNAVALIGFLLGVLSGAIFLTWLYNGSGGSILLVAVWHGLFDYVTACTECKTGVIAAAASTLVMIWGLAIAGAYWRKDFGKRRGGNAKHPDRGEADAATR